MHQGQDPAVCCAIPSRTVEVSLSLEQWLPLVGREGGRGTQVASTTSVRVYFLNSMLGFLVFVILLFLMFIYFEREREQASQHGGGERERRERIPSRLLAARTEPDAGLKPMNLDITT